MRVNVLPADQIKVAAAKDFSPGSLLFGPYSEHRVERFQIGLRVGQGCQVLALTPWFGGHRQAGSVIEPRDDRPMFGIDAIVERSTVLDFDPLSLTHESPDAWRGALGLLGFGVAGLVLYAQADDPNGLPAKRGVVIDPVTWAIIEQPAQFPNSWSSAWQVRIRVSNEDWFEIAPDRLATGA